MCTDWLKPNKTHHMTCSIQSKRFILDEGNYYTRTLFWRLAPVAIVTRFGEISPLWHNYKSIGQIFKGYLAFGKMLILLWQNVILLGKYYVAADGHIL